MHFTFIVEAGEMLCVFPPFLAASLSCSCALTSFHFYFSQACGCLPNIASRLNNVSRVTISYLVPFIIIERLPAGAKEQPDSLSGKL